MTYKELNGNKLKKDLGISRVCKRYHNSHVDGSGNFGFTVVNGENWYTLDGEYTSAGIITKISFGSYGLGGWDKNIFIPEYSPLIEYIKNLITGNNNA